MDTQAIGIPAGSTNLHLSFNGANKVIFTITNDGKFVPGDVLKNSTDEVAKEFVALVEQLYGAKLRQRIDDLEELVRIIALDEWGTVSCMAETCGTRMEKKYRDLILEIGEEPSTEDKEELGRVEAMEKKLSDLEEGRAVVLPKNEKHAKAMLAAATLFIPEVAAPPPQEVPGWLPNTDRDFTEDYATSGAYTSKCRVCGNDFCGSKHRIVCRKCAPPPTMLPAVGKSFCGPSKTETPNWTGAEL